MLLAMEMVGLVAKNEGIGTEVETILGEASVGTMVVDGSARLRAASPPLAGGLTGGGAGLLTFTNTIGSSCVVVIVKMTHELNRSKIVMFKARVAKKSPDF